MKASVNTLKQRLMLLDSVRLKDGFGGQIIKWVPRGEIWAQVKNFSLQGVTRAKSLGQRLGGLTGREQLIQITYRDGIVVKQSCRIQWNGLTFGMVCDPFPTKEKGFLQIFAAQIMPGEEGV